MPNITIAITGAGSGIGRALAYASAKRGYNLALSDVNLAALEQLKLELKLPDERVSISPVDVSDFDAVCAWRDQILAHFSGVDILINNAGVALISRAENQSNEDLARVMNINFWGVVWCTRAFIPLIKNAPVGHIVNTSSIFGMVGIAGQSAYNAAKFGVRGFSESLIAEYRNTSIAVSCVHPGGIATNIAKRSRADGEWDAVTAEERDQQFKQHTPTTPEQAAAIILAGSARRKARIMVGKDAWFVQLLARLFPVGYHALTTRWPDDAKKS